MNERRRFSRIIYRVPATLMQGSTTVMTKIQDLSLHGMLVQLPERVSFNANETIDVLFTLSGSNIQITLKADMVRHFRGSVALKTRHIDIDSITHLRRLVELNVGNDTLLHRELEHLSDLASSEELAPPLED
ncbi:PilZ domain-containing protein [Vibrio sp. SM6]|uniref:Cyclic diguanosine monophosphate-binding protein n=1 Tax=Vibrio agarilyticus TaxID=2726741 RepID=A0A7X8TPA0_9VIBR|nr:PilZ domain-containing protein [Vibrio agarilyticus]NLS12225.1 PilZ domain-containing protein [Vibrio agarilyticus]